MKDRIAPDTGVQKCPTGIAGLDQITTGGLPRGRPTLICGGAGCGKTLFGLEFLARGAREYDETGVLIAFEETGEELRQNAASLGLNLQQLVQRRKLVIDYVHVERAEIEETGAYDLDGLFVRIAQAIDSVRAERVVLDTLEVIFAAFKDLAILRSELRRLFRWLKQKGVTAVVTAERGDGTLTRYGMEEYISDCVILLDHRVYDQVSTRRLRVVKYRGSAHGTNEYPFLIDRDGISVLPATSMVLDHAATTERVSTGIPSLDAMFEGKGYYRGSSVLVSGTAGTGKSSLAAHFVDAACRRGERAYYFAFEESMPQVVRNMRSIGMNLERWVKQDLLRFHSARPTVYGLEMHLATMQQLVREFKPSVVVIDPITNFVSIGTPNEVKLTVMRLVDFLKQHGITAVMTSLSSETTADQTDVGVSSTMDTWLLLRDIESAGERNRGLYILKSRGMPHSNKIREYVLTNRGFQLMDPVVGDAGVVTGSARVAFAARNQETQRLQKSRLQRRRQSLEGYIAELRDELAADEAAFTEAETMLKRPKGTAAPKGATVAPARGVRKRGTRKTHAKK